MRAAAAAPGPEDQELTAPTFLEVFRAGAPGFLREGFLPLGAFYLGLRLGDLATAIAASAVVSVLIYLHERRLGREGLLVRISLVFVVVQSAVGLAADSTTVYLAQPVLIAAVWGMYFLARSGLRLAMLLRGSLESFLAVTFLTGTPLMLLLLAWSIRYSIRRLSD